MRPSSLPDFLTPQQRSLHMARIRGKNTGPEMVVRRKLHSLGYRYRIHVPDLPGTPDIVFLRRHKIVFVHGCFWHQHPSKRCPLARRPKARPKYWLPKFSRNVERDVQQRIKLRRLGWSVLVVWECETSNYPRLEAKLIRFLGAPSRNSE